MPQNPLVSLAYFILTRAADEGGHLLPLHELADPLQEVRLVDEARRGENGLWVLSILKTAIVLGVFLKNKGVFEGCAVLEILVPKTAQHNTHRNTAQPTIAVLRIDNTHSPLSPLQ